MPLKFLLTMKYPAIVVRCQPKRLVYLVNKSFPTNLAASYLIKRFLEGILDTEYVNSIMISDEPIYTVLKFNKLMFDYICAEPKLNDNDLETACSQSCPANAIVFGDMNDAESALSILINSERRYNLLEEIYTKPSVNYLTKIRNKKS